MALSLLEGATSGEFSGSFVVTDEATINIGNVIHEQHDVPGGLLANRALSNESHSVGSNLVQNDTFAVDTDGDAGADGGAVGVADIAIGGAAAANLEISSAGDVNVGGLQVTITGTADDTIGVGYTLTYGRAIDNELIVVPDTGDAGFTDTDGSLTVTSGDTFVVSLAATPVDGNDDGAVTTADVAINLVTAQGVSIAVNGDINTGQPGDVRFTISGDAAGESFTVDYVGQVIQNETSPVSPKPSPLTTRP